MSWNGWPAEQPGPAGTDRTLSQPAEQAAQLQDPAALARAEAARVRIAEYDAQIGPRGDRAAPDDS